MAEAPGAAALDWIVSEIAPRSPPASVTSVASVRRLVGGVTSEVHEVSLSDGTSVVLRRYPRGDGTHARADPFARDRRAAERLPGRRPDDVPAWTSRPDAWRVAIDLLAQGPPASGPECFVHRDYQHFNLLWTSGRLSGVVDWTWAVRLSPDWDVAHCRLNLAVLFSPSLAAEFLDAYESEAGRRVDPWWDVQGVMKYGPGWHQLITTQVAGRRDVDTAGMNDRVDEHLVAALPRIS